MDSTTAKLALSGRVLMALIFLVAGIRKALAFAATVGYFGKLGLPMAEVLVPLTIALEIGGGLLLIAGWQVRWTASVLALFTIGSALVAHRFWQVGDPMQFGNQLNHFLKNVAMVGGFLLVIAMAPTDRGPRS